MKAIFLALISVCAVSQAATIQLDSPGLVTGSTFDVLVNVTNVFANFPGEALTGFGFNVTGSPQVSFTGATVNSTFFDDFSGCCLGTDIVAVTNLSFPAGVGAGDFTEPLLLATLHFSVTGFGPATVGVTADNSADPNQGLYFLSGAESFSASQPLTIAAAPEPSTILLGGLGLLGVCLVRQRFSAR